MLEAFNFKAFRGLIKWGIILTTWNVNNVEGKDLTATVDSIILTTWNVNL